MTDYTNPRTWTDGEVVTASQMNTHVRDNLKALREHNTCKVYRSTNGTLTTATLTTVNFDAEAYDPNGWHSTTSNTDRITPTLSGLYLVTAGASFGASATGWREMILWRNGTSGQAFATVGRGVACTGTNSTNWVISGTISCNGSTDYISLSVEQNSGGNLTLAGSTEFVTWMSVTYLGS